MSWIALGVLLGLGAATFYVSRAWSYLSDHPETCMNCHVMTHAYVTWNHSSHREVASCTDCHVPHDSLWRTYAFKAADGLRHAAVFTWRREPQVIRLHPAAVPVVEANCRRCHDQLLSDIHMRQSHAGELRCWDCHREVPHGRVQSLSSIFDVQAPRLPGVFELPQRMHIGGHPPRPTSAKEP
ncbi:MAG: cytochrome c nitrite reductase small subunit [Planctomycetota bacterium]|nr:cytochrome c nitrite reductase small subunit [Planctomycetota bacterium]MCX8039966.1 cytochrome c nitrite reductase small subunit [Planctomycetota bacterium]